ncbi:MAG: DNA-processing protein DprA [Acidobacteriota bacterium]
MDDTKYQQIAFQLLVLNDPAARLKFIKSGRRYHDFFAMERRNLKIFGFEEKNLNKFKKNYKYAAEAEIEKAAKNGVEIIFSDDEHFPELLREIYDPPYYIYVMGDKKALTGNKLGVVGSRKGSVYGFNALRSILPDIIFEKITIVSGMAYGIDAMSHKIAIKEGGKTVGVNAGGLLNLYPSGNAGLINGIKKSGCIISEFPLDTIPRPFLFPIRNRIIAGLSKAVLVVEAEMRSGSLITARLAVEQNRDVFAIPGPVNSSLSTGTNYLIQQGAKLIRKSSDILTEYGIVNKRIKAVSDIKLTSSEKKILDLIGENEVKSINYFVESLGMSVSETITLLMGLVLKNIVSEENGGFRKIA